MIVLNKLDRSFGPFGSSTGFFMLIGGIIATWFSIIGLLIVILGAFAAFTTTSTAIDLENKRMKHSDNLFGIIRVGKWIDIKPGMKLGLIKSHRGYVGYIRGTQPVGLHDNDIRIILYDSGNKQIMPVKKFSSYNSAKDELADLCALIGLPLI